MIWEGGRGGIFGITGNFFLLASFLNHRPSKILRLVCDTQGRRAANQGKDYGMNDFRWAKERRGPYSNLHALSLKVTFLLVKWSGLDCKDI